MTTPIDIAELERLEREATSVPWSLRATVVRGVEYSVSGVTSPHGVTTRYLNGGDSISDYVCTPALGHSTERGQDACKNMEFIAASRNALPELIASLKIAVEALKKYRGIAGSDCANSVTQYSVADEALAEIQKRVTL